MKLFADENVDGRLIAALRDAGHELAWAAEDMPGAADGAVLEWARANDAILLTDDLDFGELVFRQRRAASGVLLLRMAGLSLARKRAIVLDALNEHGQDLYGRFAVLDLRQLRIRPLQV